MAEVPDKVLAWLYNVLATVSTCVLSPQLRLTATGLRRRKPNLLGRRRDALQVPLSLPANRSLQSVDRPAARRSLNEAAFENGLSALLLLVRGTIPVQFRGATYRFPVDLWVPHAYPKEGIFAYVVPSGDMLVRPGQHVGGDGRIYHPYLAQWAKYWDVR